MTPKTAVRLAVVALEEQIAGLAPEANYHDQGKDPSDFAVRASRQRQSLRDAAALLGRLPGLAQAAASLLRERPELASSPEGRALVKVLRECGVLRSWEFRR